MVASGLILAVLTQITSLPGTPRMVPVTRWRVEFFPGPWEVSRPHICGTKKPRWPVLVLVSGAFYLSGRYWVRTSDLSGVNGLPRT